MSLHEPKALSELIGLDSSRRPCVRASVGLFTLSYMNISETSWPIIITFHLKHHLGGVWLPDRIRTLVSMAIDSSHRVIKSCEHSSSSIFHWIFFILAGKKDSNKSLDGFEIRQDWTRVYGVNCPLNSEKIDL